MIHFKVFKNFTVFDLFFSKMFLYFIANKKVNFFLKN